jgi:hypothetical protein
MGESPGVFTNTAIAAVFLVIAFDSTAAQPIEGGLDTKFVQNSIK